MNTTAVHVWTAICHIDDIPPLGARIVRPEGLDAIAVFRASDGHVFAVFNRCPHKGGPLSDGLVHGHTVTCPLHNWNINLENGEACAPDTGCVRTIDVRLHDGRVYLALPGLE
ncbi:nitrite reductase small subunit NirD [Allopusillimonas ginsengisoli]|uniref:nitrite reductase small subunit NirD n=1 Tax=Allopusillimonas ginsengisoli TaxID=453575 RepID=UPI0010216957|nr:nitrite reductase small subunit NirD [Allopusillimonas ginsengisoli]TEA76972.1 nitrite reductase small subunit NirD [Allopusillimonas ginsengisoli]